MKNCGIVCEYNPFHTGHKYQLEKVREAGFDNIVCVMSGQFVQAALPAFCDKAIRAECAVISGADAVIELPTVYSTASAQIFAEGAVKIMAGIKNLSYIAMGAVANANDILRLADIKITHKEEFENALKVFLDDGKSYNSASAAALINVYSKHYPGFDDISYVLDDPNNILCIEYISAINKISASIQPMIIQRAGSTYNDTRTDGDHISATAIRTAESDGRFSDVKRYIPYGYNKIVEWRNNHAPDMRSFKNILEFAVRRSDFEHIRNMRDCSEGLEYLLKSISDKYDYDGYIEYISGKRYSKKRIARLLLDIVLNINKNAVEKNFCTRLLSCTKKFDFSALPDYVVTNNADIKRLASNSDVNDVLQIDIAAVDLYNTICRINGSYFNYSLIKV